MSFNRGDNVKKALNIGISNMLNEKVPPILEKYRFKILDSETQNSLKKEIEDMMGVSLMMKINHYDDGTITIEIEIEK